MTPFPAGPRIGGDRHGAVAQRQRIPFATGRSRVRIPPAPPDGSSRGAPDKALVRTDSHHALEKAMGGTVKAPMAQWQRSRLVSGRSPVRIRLGALGRRPRACRPEGRAARRAASWTPPFASVVQWQARRSPKPSIRVRVPAGVRRRHPPFWPIGASAPGEDGDGFGMWRSWQRARLGAARPRVRVPPFRRGKTQQDRACPHEGEIRRMARTRQAAVAAASTSADLGTTAPHRATWSASSSPPAMATGCGSASTER